MTNLYRIAIFFHTLNGGGVERMLLRIAKAISQRGYNVDVVVMSACGNMRDEVPDGIRLIDLGSPYIIPSLINFIKYIVKYRPRVILSATSIPNTIAVLSNKVTLGRARVVISERVSDNLIYETAVSIKQKILKFFILSAYRRADAIIAVSKSVAARLSAVPGIRTEFLYVVYNPTWTPMLDSLSREPVDHDWFSSGAGPIVLGVGRLSHEKGFDSLIAAFAALDERHQARLVIVGEGGQRHAIEQLVREYGLQERVSLPGYAKNPWAYMARSSVFVLSSRYEGLPNVLIEAMACGVSVVSTDCPGGASEILEGGRLGSLVPLDDIKALTHAIECALESPMPTDTLKDKARTFSIEQSVDGYLDILEDFAACVKPSWR